MIDPRHEHIAELDRLQRQSNALRRSLNGLKTGTRNVQRLAAQLDDDLAQLRDRIATTQPEEAQHDHEREPVHY
jgi:predicted  nucleic acid-binding Zn-ribbon protein